MTAKILTQQYLKECLSYDPESGIFTWLKRPRHHFRTKQGQVISNNIFGGKPAGCRSKSGYWHIHLGTLFCKGHHLAFLYMTGAYPSGVVDHIDHDCSNNKWCNLRDVSRSVNGRNRAMGLNSKYSVMGVYPSGSKWKASIKADGKQKYLGIFESYEDAVVARKSAEATFGYHPNHGVICHQPEKAND